MKEVVGKSTVIDFPEKFENSRKYWKRAIDEGRAHNSEIYRHVFESEEAELYREFCDDEMLMDIAKALNETWVGVNREGRIDEQNLPASSATPATSASRGSAGKS